MTAAPPTRRQRRAMINRRECYLCGARVAVSAAVYWPDHSVLTCRGACERLFRDTGRDFGRSRRGRRIPLAEHLRRLEPWRRRSERAVRPPRPVELSSPRHRGEA